MKTISQRVFSPGPELSKLISDQVSLLRESFEQVDWIHVNMWVEDTHGARQKYCEINMRFQDNELHVTKCGSTHILALMDAVRTVRRRIASKIKSHKL